MLLLCLILLRRTVNDVRGPERPDLGCGEQRPIAAAAIGRLV